MAEDRMAVLETLRKAIADGDVDFLREGVRVLAQAVMEAEVTELTGVAQGRARPGAPPDPPQRVPRPALGHPGRHDRARHPAGPRRLVLPEPARAAPAGRAGPARGGPGGVRAGRQHPPGRRPRPGPGDRRDQQERGQPDLRRARRRGRAPSATRSLADERVPVPLARRHGAPRGAIRPSGMEGPTAGLSQQSGEAGGSLNLETQARAGAAPTTTGRVGTARRPGSGKQDGTVQVGLNQWWNPLKREHRLEPGGSGPGSSSAVVEVAGDRLRSGAMPSGRRATEKACGVSVAKAAGEKLGTTPVDRS